MSVVLVTGGSGVLGTHVARLLRERDHEVRVLSRRADKGTHVGDLTTGDGVAAAAAGADVVVHAASETMRNGKSDLTQTRQLLQATRDVRHLLYPSIVGIEAIPHPYYKRKLACERAIVESGVPATILRATQFHELLALMLGKVERMPLAPLPLTSRFQSVAAADVAARVVELVDGEPLGRAPDFGGPEVLTLREIVATWRAVHGRPRRVVNVPLPGRMAAGYRKGLNTCPDHADGRQRWAEFVT